MRKLLGYRLKEEKYREAAERIANGSLCLRGKSDYFHHNSSTFHELNKAGVMHWFKEVYEEEELEVGKWYKRNNQSFGYELVFITGKERNYGFGSVGIWSETLSNELDEKNYTEATTEEIEQALIKEATKRGFKDKSRITDVDNDSELIDFSSPNYSSRGNWFELGCAVVFRDGKWAEILPSETLNGKTAIIDGVEYELKIKN